MNPLNKGANSRKGADDTDICTETISNSHYHCNKISEKELAKYVHTHTPKILQVRSRKFKFEKGGAQSTLGWMRAVPRGRRGVVGGEAGRAHDLQEGSLCRVGQ
jgi:hypothetical protein